MTSTGAKLFYLSQPYYLEKYLPMLSVRRQWKWFNGKNFLSGELSYTETNLDYECKRTYEFENETEFYPE